MGKAARHWARRGAIALTAVTLTLSGVGLGTRAPDAGRASPPRERQRASIAANTRPTPPANPSPPSSPPSSAAPAPAPIDPAAPPTTTTIAPVAAATDTLPPFDLADQAPGWEQRRGEAALARLPYDWRATGFTIEFVAPRAGYLGSTYPSARLTRIWVRANESLDVLMHTIAHELGHAVDLTWGDAARREQYRHVRGLDGRDWFTCGGCTDYSTPAGDFAEVFASWLAGPSDFRSELAGPPSPEQLVVLEPLFRPAP